VPRVADIPGRYRFYFYSFDCAEPKHVHARRDGMVCTLWLEPVGLARNHRFTRHELHVIRTYVDQYLARVLEAWDEHCG
jgi:hypothetical protein